MSYNPYPAGSHEAADYSRRLDQESLARFYAKQNMEREMRDTARKLSRNTVSCAPVEKESESFLGMFIDVVAEFAKEAYELAGLAADKLGQWAGASWAQDNSKEKGE